MIGRVLDRISAKIENCPAVRGIVLGGSRATGTATETSDIDIGVYYCKEELDYASLNEAARALDDEHRTNLICREGEWGNWVNCGGWLVVGGCRVDLILRDIQRVQEIVGRTNKGVFTANYQTGHPHAYIDVMYRGELASAKLLYAKEDAFLQLKKQAEVYPDALQQALLSFFLFEARFSCMFAEKSTAQDDFYYVTGHLFRSVSALHQVLFALNREWCLNEKKALLRIDAFKRRPDEYSRKVNCIFGGIGETRLVSAQKLHELCDEVAQLCEA